VTGGSNANAFGNEREEQQSHQDDGNMASITEHRRVARCECGALLVGDSEQELYEAAELHLARHHPQLLGALELDVVSQMAENVGGGGA
jgi:hypothetical protein